MRRRRRCLRSDHAACGRRPKRGPVSYGSIALVELATGISRATIQPGLRELDANAPLPQERIRKPWWGPQPQDRGRHDIAPGCRRAGAPDGAPRSGLAAPLNQQECADVGGGPSRRSPTGSATRLSPNCCTRRATACKGMRRRARGAASRRETSSRISSRPSDRRSSGGGRTISGETKKKELIGDFKHGGRACARRHVRPRART